MNGSLPLIIEDAKKLANAVFKVYPQILANYTTLIGPVSIPEQQKILFDLCVACIGIANKESRVAAWKEERKNGNGHSNGNNENEKPSPPTPPQPPKPSIDNEPMTLEEPRKEYDERDRPTEQLIQELNIKSPAQAGWLRARKEISYIEWRRVKDYVSQQEIQGAGGFSFP